MLSLPHGTPSVGTVVLADDDAAFREVVKGMLTGIADRLIEAEDGAQALAAVAQGDIDLVLADLGCPAWTGTRCLSACPRGFPPSSSPAWTCRRRREPPRCRKEELTRERLAFVIRRVSQETR